MTFSVASWIRHRFYPKAIQAVNLFPPTVPQRHRHTHSTVNIKLGLESEDLQAEKEQDTQDNLIQVETCPGQAQLSCMQ